MHSTFVILDEKIVNALLLDLTRSNMEIAEELGTYRQKVWRKKMQLEEGGIIWGNLRSGRDRKVLNGFTVCW